MEKRKLQKLLSQPYSQENWKQIVQFVFPNVSIRSTPYEYEINDNYVKKFRQIGDVKLDDGKNLALFELILAENIDLKRNRVGLNDRISKYIDQEGFHGVLSVFDQQGEDYRFTFSSKSTNYDADLEEIVQSQTDKKRFTYVLGKNQSCKTPAERFYSLSQKDEIKINNVIDAFNVENLSKEFFDKYKKQFEKFWKYIDSKEEYNNVFINGQGERQVKIRNFTKKLLGRIVFLHFLQKKGWMGCPENESWGSGDKKFMQTLFKDFTNKDQFHSQCLVELFYNTLNNKRDDFLFKCEGLEGILNNSKIPYLNGGLFDSDRLVSTKIDFPKSYFQDLFDFFGQYNFTIDENDPNDHEVGIDPEMLGHIFENLLEDNKDKGAFYTPKVIVQYMCQESLIEYLATKLEAETSDEVKLAIEDLIRNRLAVPISNLDLVEPIAQALFDVKICDPAIGSGAFPMGILNVIYQVIEALYYLQPDSVARVWNISDKQWQPHLVKKNIIQNSIYGVDIESGAVDIARLRFWLALVVDEVEPLPLPNLDYKIMQGNSLLESFEGIDLSQISDAAAYEAVYESEQIELFSGEAKKKVSMSLQFENVKTLMDDYFNANDPETKKDLHKRIDDQVLNHIRFTLAEHKIELQKKAKKLEKKVSLDEAAARTREQKEKIRTNSKAAKALVKLNAELSQYNDKELKLAQLSNSNERPFFLWNLFFQEVFDRGGFDIVIGNPPYGVSIKGDYRKYILEEIGKVPDYEIYYYFIELSKKILVNKGVLSYIIPNSYLFNTFANSYREDILNEWGIVEILDCTKFNIFTSATVRNTINTWKFKVSQPIGYRKTGGVNSFKELTSKPRKYLEKDNLLAMNQNWGLAFMLEEKIITTVKSIAKDSTNLDDYFDISQGYIPYRKSDLIKHYGKEKGSRILTNREWHSDKKENDSYKREIQGRNLTKYTYTAANSYVFYGKHLAGYIDLKFFNQKRLLIREITNPTIIASIVSEELVNDPQIISIIQKEGTKINLEYLWAILSSKLATFFHFNHSPKATKGAFPKILVKDIREFPIPIELSADESVLKVIQKTLNLGKEGKDTATQERKLNIWVCRIYGLSYEEAYIIDNEIGLSREEYKTFSINDK